MNKQKLIPILTAVLAAQILLAVGLNVGGGDYKSAPDDEKLLTVDTGTIDTIRLTDGDESIELTRSDDAWTVRSLDFPAAGVDALLDKLAGMNKGWPVATTAEAAERFKVAESDYKRKVTLLKDGEPAAELYVGTSPGLRKLHARLAGDSNIYSVELNLHLTAVSSDDWIDKGVLKRDAETIARLQLPNNVTLQREDDQLVLAGLGEQEQTKTTEAERLFNKVANMQIKAVLGKEPKPEYGLDDPAYTVTLTIGDGETVTYSINKLEGKDDYALKSSDNEHYFRVASYTLNDVVDPERDKLVEPKETASEEETTDSAPKQSPHMRANDS